ncbi:MFS transporter [Brevibacterium sp. Re57]|uniref:MFS transporter n=2 Tax=Brevibacterium gallinarum TaxID=2762220 RepID=A0ABR8WQS2_9MICO|nr:MFS transporter [Brevibacterium gallinarum]
MWLWLLVAAAVCTQTGVYLLRPVTTYKLIDLGAGATSVGLVTAIYALVPLVAALALGRLSDRTTRLRLMVLVGALILVAGGVLLALAQSLVLVAVANAILGIGHLVFTIAGQSSIARYARADQLDFGFGWFTAAYSAGQMIGPLGVTLLLGSQAATRTGEVSLALWLGAIITAGAVPLMFFSSRAFQPRQQGSTGPEAGERTADPQPETDAPDTTEPEKARVRSILSNGDIRAAMLSSLALLAVLDILVAFLPLVGEEHGVAPAWIGVLLAVRGVSSIISRVFLPYFSHRFDRRLLVFVSVLGAGLSLIFPPIVLDWMWLAALLMLISGFFLGLGQPLTMALITSSVPSAWRGSALAMRLMGNRIGQVAMPLIAGVIAAPAGPAAAIWCGSALLLAAAGHQYHRNRVGGVD